MESEFLNNFTVSFYTVCIAHTEGLDRDFLLKAGLNLVKFLSFELFFSHKLDFTLKPYNPGPPYYHFLKSMESEFLNNFTVSIHNVRIASAQRLDRDFSPKA